MIVASFVHLLMLCLMLADQFTVNRQGLERAEGERRARMIDTVLNVDKLYPMLSSNKVKPSVLLCVTQYMCLSFLKQSHVCNAF